MDLTQGKQLLGRLMQGGAQVGVWGCVLVALIAAAPTLPMPTLLTFLGSVGGNLVASILDRAAEGESVDESALRQLLALPNQLNAIEKLIKEGILPASDVDRIMASAESLAKNVGGLQQQISDARDASHREHTYIYDEIRAVRSELQRLLSPPSLTEDQRWETLSRYAQALLLPRYTRMSTGGLVAESPRVADQIREPTLDDTFVEPFLTRAGSLRESREEVDRLLDLIHDDEEEILARDEARSRLLRLRSDTWDKIWRGGQAQPASQVLSEYRAVVILGDPGAGKSTLIRWLLVGRAREIQEEAAGRVPLLVAVGDYANAWETEKKQGHSLALTDYLERHAQRITQGMGEVVRQALGPGGSGVLLLLDGLDEVPRDLRRSVAGRIQDFLAYHVGDEQPSRLLVCSRFFGYEEAPITDPAVQVVVAPFNNAQIRGFARRWHVWLEKHLHRDRPDLDYAEAEAEHFEAALFSRPQITELARNPLMLTMIAVVIRQGKVLPRRRVELYDLALRQLMTQWEYLRGETLKTFHIDYGQACQLWAPVARWMHEVGTGAVHEEELKKRLRDRLKELELEETAEDWLTVRGDKTCLLQERGTQVFGFLHQTFQEYLAAQDIFSEGEFVKDLGRYIQDPRWHETLRLACGYLGVVANPPQKANVTALLRRILEAGSPYESLLHRDLLLAATCIADDVNPRKDIEREIVTRLLQLASSGAVEPLVIEAMDLLVENARIEIDSAVLENAERSLVDHPNSLVRYRLTRWLKERPGPPTDHSLRQLSEDANENISILANALLWQSNPTQEMLSRILEHLPLAPQADLEVISILRQNSLHVAELLKSLQSTALVNAAGLLLETEQREQGINALLALLKDDESLGWQAVELLSNRPEILTQAVPALLNLLKAESGSQRRQAAELLLKTKERQKAVDVLLDQLKARSGRLRRQAAKLLLKTEEHRKAVDALLDLLKEDGRHRRQAAELLLETEECQRAVDALLTLLKEDESQRCQAAELLSNRPDVIAQAAPELTTLLKAGSGSQRWQAARLLLKTEDRREAVDALLALMKEDESHRWQAAKLLLKTEERRKVIGTLLSLLKAGSGSQRWHAARLLLETEERQKAVGALLALMKENRNLGSQAADLLSRQPGILARYTPTLVSLLKEGSRNQRMKAARLLSSHPWILARATPDLITLLKEVDEDLRRQAARLLSKTEEREYVATLIAEVLKGEDIQRLESIGPGDRIYEAAWLYATLTTSQQLLI